MKVLTISELLEFHLKPFDIRAVLLAKHAQHVVLIHFPIALFIVGVGFDFAAHWTARATFAAVAYYNLMVAALAALPVLGTGLLAWQLQFGGRKLKGILLFHLVLAFTSSTLMWFFLWLQVRAKRAPAQHPLPSFRLPLELLTVVIIMLTAHLGGFLSGVNAPG